MARNPGVHNASGPDLRWWFTAPRSVQGLAARRVWHLDCGLSLSRLLATRTAESVRKGDRVTVMADDLIAEAWTATGSGEPRARVTLRAREIAASTAFDSLRTNYAARKAARAAAANGEPNDLPAGEQAEVQVLRGVTTTT